MNYLYFLFDHSSIRYVFGTFVVLAIYLRIISSYDDQTDYAKERSLFKDFKNNTFSPQSIADWIASIFFIIALLAFAWNIFYKVGIRHFDSIGIIDTTVCMNSYQGVWVNNGRFMPLAHQEFNLLSWLIRLLDCSYGFLYSVTFLQFLVTLFFIEKILPFQKLWQRILAIIFIATNVSFFQPFSNLIINDRNLIFLTILTLYNIIKFYKTGSHRSLSSALICANLAIYFKEPAFLFFSGFAITFLAFKIIENKISLKSIIKRPFDFTKKYPLEVGLLGLSLLFVISYVFFVLTVKQETFYGFSGNDMNYFSYLLDTFLRFPLFAAIIAVLVAFLNDFRKMKYRNFISSLLVGGVLYALAVSAMRNTKVEAFYYYCIASLAITLAAFYYLAEEKKSKLFTTILLCVALLTINLTISNVSEVFILGKSRQIWIHSLKKNIQLNKDQKYNIFYYEKMPVVGEYMGSTILALLRSITHNNSPIHLYTTHGCYPWNQGKEGDKFRCDQANISALEKYDIVIFDRASIGEDEWKKLKNQYGNKIIKITSYPRFLNNSEKENLYMMKNSI
jgi:hypothetical protein